MTGWGGATFEDADQANKLEDARIETYWETRETAADRAIDALATAALLAHPDRDRVEITVSGWRVWAIRAEDGYVLRTDDELYGESPVR